MLTSLIFSGMSGSAVSDVAGVGKVMTDMMMEKNRYPRGFAGAITAASSVVGPIFPPSIPLVFYALVSSTSVGVLFLAGVVPALLIVAMLSATVYIVAKRRGFPVEATIAWAASGSGCRMSPGSTEGWRGCGRCPDRSGAPGGLPSGGCRRS